MEIQALRSNWRHEQHCRALKVGRDKSVSTDPAAMGSAAVTSTSGSGTLLAVQSGSDTGTIPDTLETIEYSDEIPFGFDDNILMDIPDPVLDEILGPSMTRT
jgi:hypothetical protein